MSRLLYSATSAIANLWSAGSLTPKLRPTPAADPDQIQHRPADEEKLKAGPSGVHFPLFLPYFDTQQQVGETQQMRAAYRIMLADPNIKSAVLSKILAVAALELTINPSDKKDQRALDIAAFVDWSLTRRLRGGVMELVWSILSGGLIDGYSVNEKVWGQETDGKWQGKRVLRRLKPKDVNNDLVPLIDQYKNVIGIKGLRYNAGEVFDPADFLIYSHLGLYGNPGGMSDLRAAYGRYWILDTVTKLRAMGAEKRALPVIAGEYPDNDPTKQAGLETALARVKSQNWLSVPAGVKLQVLDIAGRSNEYFSDFCKELREEIVLGIMGAVLQSMQGGAGVQRGSSSVHKDTSDLWKWHLKSAIESILNAWETGLIRDLVNPNFADVQEFPWASFGGIDEAELGESAKIDLALHQMGMDLSREDLSERYGRKTPSDPADTIKGATLPVGGARPGGNQPGARLAEPVGVPAAVPFCEPTTSWGYPLGRTG